MFALFASKQNHVLMEFTRSFSRINLNPTTCSRIFFEREWSRVYWPEGDSHVAWLRSRAASCNVDEVPGPPFLQIYVKDQRPTPQLSRLPRRRLACLQLDLWIAVDGVCAHVYLWSDHRDNPKRRGYVTSFQRYGNNLLSILILRQLTPTSKIRV